MQTRLLHSGIVIVGTTIFPLLLIELTLHLFPVSSATAAMVQSFISHDCLNQSEALTLFTLMTGMSSTSRENEMKKTQVMTTAEVGWPRIFAKA